MTKMRYITIDGVLHYDIVMRIEMATVSECDVCVPEYMLLEYRSYKG